ncbi:Got1/Sft2-like vescicle transport protein family [Rhynchospora pubera]|uniref:Got1/Sft2-like vescicle transport protein family n=1 Tax=Rhynchospora pubera TaxID=906938 RepID=A0AAV8D3X8_9POAL|nr:Got1/Sft2-like vescicle transport protein family [Rhynchospora pubera]
MLEEHKALTSTKPGAYVTFPVTTPAFGFTDSGLHRRHPDPFSQSQFQIISGPDFDPAVYRTGFLNFNLYKVASFSVRMAYEISEIKKVGIGLIGFGFFFSFLGVILFFDRGLLALGNLFFLSGVGLLLGFPYMFQLFTSTRNLKGTIPFFLGIFLIFVRWPIFGIIMEIYGSFVLFSGFGPSIKVFLCQIPVLGWIIQYPLQIYDKTRHLFG